MTRRFPKVLDFEYYTNEDMNTIFRLFVNETAPISDILDVKGVIFSLNDAGVFSNQAGDMLNLAQMISEDAMLFGKEYTRERINLSFKKFCAIKNLAINFA